MARSRRRWRRRACSAASNFSTTRRLPSMLGPPPNVPSRYSMRRPRPPGRWRSSSETSSAASSFTKRAGMGSTVFTGKIGQAVASPIVTAIDDGTMPSRWGTLAVDDEGVPTRRNVLIQDGILVSYMYDRLRAGQQNHPVTGNGRRQSYQHLPIPRMTNTFIAAGAHSVEDIIAATPRGLYAKKLGAGQVDVTTGDFVFAVTEGYLIDGGRIGRPVRGATIVGNGPRALHKIDMVANDLKLAPGTCGKEGQGVPVSVGQPTIRISELTVGGTGVVPAGAMRQ